MGAKTVFILGAGASRPYGYPTGAELRKELCKDFCVDMDRMQGPEFNQGLKHFSKTFFESSISSIDLFLSKNPRFEHIGKSAIVQRILKAEKVSRFAEDIESSQDWYFYLFNKLLGSTPKKDAFDEFNITDYSFVTFNYDRSLEHFLCNSLVHAYSESPFPQILSHINKLKIWHVYGQVSKLPWQAQENGFDYKLPGYEPDSSFFNFLSKNIKVIHEGNRIDGKEIDEIKSEIKQAQTIIFLGFGFAKENMDVLGLPNILKPETGLRATRHIFATTLGLGGKFKNDTIRAFKNVNDTINGNHFENVNCLELLREFVF